MAYTQLAQRCKNISSDTAVVVSSLIFYTAFRKGHNIEQKENAKTMKNKFTMLIKIVRKTNPNLFHGILNSKPSLLSDNEKMEYLKIKEENKNLLEKVNKLENDKDDLKIKLLKKETHTVYACKDRVPQNIAYEKTEIFILFQMYPDTLEMVRCQKAHLELALSRIIGKNPEAKAIRYVESPNAVNIGIRLRDILRIRYKKSVYCYRNEITILDRMYMSSNKLCEIVDKLHSARYNIEHFLLEK